MILLFGRLTMITGWRDLIGTFISTNRKEFVSVDARLDDLKKDTRSYEMLSRDTGKTMEDVVTPSSLVSPLPHVARPDYTPSGRRTPDYFGHTARYQPPTRSFSSPRPPTQSVTWDTKHTYTRPTTKDDEDYEDVNPLGMNRI